MSVPYLAKQCAAHVWSDMVCKFPEGTQGMILQDAGLLAEVVAAFEDTLQEIFAMIRSGEHKCRGCIVDELFSQVAVGAVDMGLLMNLAQGILTQIPVAWLDEAFDSPDDRKATICDRILNCVSVERRVQ